MYRKCIQSNEELPLDASYARRKRPCQQLTKILDLYSLLSYPLLQLKNVLDLQETLPLSKTRSVDV